MKNERDAGFSRKRGGNAGSGPPFPDPVKATRSSTEVPQELQTTWFAHGNFHSRNQVCSDKKRFESKLISRTGRPEGKVSPW